MINDLDLAVSTVSRDAQVCIIGAGTAGLFLATLLRRSGIQVIVLEAGVSGARSAAQMGVHCDQTGDFYRGAELGRSFGLGGTSVVWGGQLIPMAPTDFSARPECGFDGWPLGYADVAAYIAPVRDLLSLSAATAASDTADGSSCSRGFQTLGTLGPEFEVRLSEWLPFKKRNFASCFVDAFKADDGIEIWLNAAVIGMSRASAVAGAVIDGVTARSPNGRTMHVSAAIVVVSAGALESTRLLLEFDESTEGAITAPGAPLGRYFSDHLSVTCGRITCLDRRRYNLAVAPIFSKGVMKSPRLVLSPQLQSELDVSSAFFQMTFVTAGDTGFDVIRTLLRQQQSEHTRVKLTPMMCGRMAADLGAMAYWRMLHGRLWIPSRAELLLQLDIEQHPNPDSRLYLSSARDASNRKKLVIDWRITPADTRAIRVLTKLATSAWQHSEMRRVAELQVNVRDDETIVNLYDVYHPTGTIRMGNSPKSSVVDRDLRLWASPNCYVTTTAVFPSMGSANPGLTHLALTARLAETILQQITPN